MNLILSGTLWALVTFYGPMKIDGTLYLNQVSCQKALHQALDRPRCTPPPGRTFCIANLPKMRCVKMKSAPGQISQKHRTTHPNRVTP